MKNVLAVAAVLALAMPAAAAEPSRDWPRLEGPYLGQEPPGETPAVFAAGLIEPDLHGCPVFTADGLEGYWSPMEGPKQVFGTRFEEEAWTEPVPIAIGGGPDGAGEPCLGPGDRELFFVGRVRSADGRSTSSAIWLAERVGDGWGRARRVGEAVNALGVHWQIAVSPGYDIYFGCWASGGGDIYHAEFRDGTYADPVRLDEAVNGPHYDFSPGLAPDGSYLVFSRLELSTDEEAELYISYRDAEGGWTDARALDVINRPGSNEACPNVTRDGKYLFYLGSTEGGLSAHWVAASALERYRRDGD